MKVVGRPAPVSHYAPQLLALLLVTPATAQQVEKPLLSIGSLNEPETSFGRISEVVVDLDGRIAVFDEQRAAISVFDSTGHFISVVGGRGRGPGELGRQLWGARRVDGTVVVADPGNVRLTHFDLADDRPFRGSIRLDFPPVGVCTLGNRTFVLASQGPNLVHEIGPDGSTVRSFASVPRIPDLVGMNGDHFAAHASLTCDPTSGTVVVANTFFPIVRAYAADGSPLWTVRTLTGWAQQGFELGPDGSCCIYLRPLPGADRFHTAVSSVVDPRSRSVLLAVRERTSGEARSYLIYQLAIDDGRELSHFEAPGLLLEQSGDRAYFVMEAPFPSVAVHRIVH